MSGEIIWTIIGALARRVPLLVWIAVALLITPWYLAYAAWVLTRWGGVETFMPRTP